MKSLSPKQRSWQQFLRHKTAVLSLLFLLAIMVFTLLWPTVTPYKPDLISDAQFQPPGVEHWLGTDVHGRDLLSRICHGFSISLLVGIVGALVSLLIGVTWGGVAGYFGGRLDAALMRFVDILYTLPSIVFVIVLITTLEGLVRNWLASVFPANAVSFARMIFLFAGLGAVSWLTMARIVRGQVLSLRHRQFIDASRALGATHTRLLLRHLLPNVSGVIIVYLTLTIPSVILYESFLSYLGLGIRPPQASLGSLIAEGATQINPVRIYWWMVVFPAGTLVSLLLALSFIGDGLKEALDPRSSTVK